MNWKPNNARDAAVLALRDEAGNVSGRLRRLLQRSSLPVGEQALATELALGCVRRRGTLEAVLRAFLKQPERKLPTPLTEILCVALYQVLFLDRVPEFAAVNEAVGQAGRLHHKRQSGLVNGVLRSIARSISAVTEGPPPVSSDVIPVGPDCYRTTSRAIFADPQDDPAGYLAGAFSLPEQLAERWLGRFGSLQEAAAIAAHACARPPLVLRVNCRRASVEEVIARLGAAGIDAAAHANGCSVALRRHVNVRELAVFREGLIQPQDAAATNVVLSAAPTAGMNVLDFCAAPGTKTTHLAELMDDRGSITAVDVSENKLNLIRENCCRLGIGIVATLTADRVGGLEPASFDLVLTDVPCSNTGVLARRPEARWRFSGAALDKLVADQRSIAAVAARFVRPGGRLIYSTCSIEPEENGSVVQAVLKRSPQLRLVREKLSLPTGADDPAQWRDGGYVAVLEAET